MYVYCAITVTSPWGSGGMYLSGGGVVPAHSYYRPCIWRHCWRLAAGDVKV